MDKIPRIFDLRLLEARRARARRLAVPGADFLFERAVADLGDRLAAVQRAFPRAAIIGPDTGALQALLGNATNGVVETATIEAGPSGERLALEPGSIDLAVSVLALQWVNDLPGVMAQIRRALRPDGLFLGVLVGGEALKELRDVLTAAESEIRGGAAPRIAPFADLRDMGSLLQRAGFALPVTDTDRVVVRYDTMFALVRDLRAMGATSVLVDRDPRPLTRDIAARAAILYAERHADPDGRIRATFDLISLSGWAPDASQPKPLKPGSAKLRLQDAIEAAAKEALNDGETS
ncbi:SAM-dependent methyltransferase [Kaistia algarum]|uniref:methyltransferase domain-containing protein n=1 Tax=Kaistia algarum TaxID=2083279 RepID=UPI000CE841E2|nr:methyltransferase domain-containing protein [Kaistia algarum]MCX5514485.1 methyltransferase domain-containing protein [Kaistia algarum]PPE79212.1 SAM-dependent methyltransferase [Kaistia algarum]